jgi:hypothetical protein
MKLRVGRKVGRTLYWQRGDEPSDMDELVGMVDTPDWAYLICHAVNDSGMDPRMWVQDWNPGDISPWDYP